MSCIHVTVTAALMRIPRVRHMNMTRFGAAMNGRSLSRYLYNTHLPNESLVALDEHEHAWYVTGRAEGCSRIPDCVFLTSLLRSLLLQPRASSQTRTTRQAPCLHVVSCHVTFTCWELAEATEITLTKV